MARRAPLPTTGTIETLDPARVERLRRLAVLLDDSIPIPGTRFRIGVEFGHIYETASDFGKTARSANYP